MNEHVVSLQGVIGSIVTPMIVSCLMAESIVCLSLFVVPILCLYFVVAWLVM